MTGSAPALLTRAERERIAEAVRRAEAATTGEIVVIVARRAGLYRSAAPAAALLAGLLVPWPLIALTGLSAASIAAIQALAALAVLLAALDERLRLRLVPRPIRQARVADAAAREFRARGLARTRERTGVLIYVALAERHAEIVADRAVRARIPADSWRGVIAGLLRQAACGALAEGLAGAVAQVGGLLAVELPAGPNRNELPDPVILLD